MRSFVIKALGALGFAYCVTVALLWLQQDSFIFPAPQVPVSQQAGDRFDVVAIPTPDGETLQSLFHPASRGRPTVIVFHGNGDAAEYQRSRGRLLAEAGFGVLLAEYRGYGGSSGAPSQTGLFTDGLAAYDFAAGRSDGPIAIYAHSLGTGVAVEVASQRDVAAMVLESPFDSLLAVAQRRFPWAPAGWLLRHPFPSDTRIGKLTMPILIMHGDRDRTIPISHGRALARHAGENTSFRVIEGGGHNDLASFGTIEQALAFFQDHLG